MDTHKHRDTYTCIKKQRYRERQTGGHTERQRVTLTPIWTLRNTQILAHAYKNKDTMREKQVDQLRDRESH